jgi:diguanylate cyclase (GGDEF)-like protein
MGFAAACLLAALILPMAGNGIIIVSGNKTLSLIGCYMYYLGLDISIGALLYYTHIYCRITRPVKWIRNAVSSVLLADMVQLLLNPFLHHAFDITEIEVDGFPYFKMIPHLGQQVHRVIDYLILAGIIVVFIIRLVKAPRLQTERYWVILVTLLLVTAWETVYIFSGSPIDRSMIGFGVFGLLNFYFSLYYRPMRLLDRMLSGMVSGQANPVFFFDDSMHCIWMNRAGEQFLDLEEHELEEAEARLKKEFGGLHPGLAEWKDHQTVDKNGEKRYIELTKQPLIDSKRKMDGFYFHIHDLTNEQRAAEQKLFTARHDQLTGLFNRDYLYERTKELLAENPEEVYLIITAEITDLKVINELYGNTFGDQALKFAAEWMRNNENVNRGGVYGRLGGDSFGVCIPEKDFRLERMEFALSNLTVFEGETKYRMLIHAGIYRVDDRSLKASVMYDRAVLALEGIKDDYHYHTAWYEPYMRENALRNKRIAEELTAAIADGQIRPWLQPIVDREKKIIGAEALARWIHPVEGIRFPGDCIPVLEKHGMIADLDRCIWRQACMILAPWKEEGKDLFLSVNISPRDFYLLDVAGELKSMVREYGVEPSKLRLEITESVMMTDDENRMKILRDMQSCGFLIEMDDFGSGYSSLNLLREMPVDVLKIDMVFLRNTADQEWERARTIVEDVISMANHLSITSLTEGVETEYQYSKLREMGCQLYQGFYFAKPMPVEEFEQYLSSNNH